MQVVTDQRGVSATDDQGRMMRASQAGARARSAALEFQAALSDLCALGVHVTVRVEPGFEEGALSPSTYYVEVETF